jgi:23S rRNA (cytidine1920-2'-O)/16S rRNA (cytidine1409-2'-O)-methyltransferase
MIHHRDVKPGRQRLDHKLVELGLADSRQKAQAMILAGNVLVDEQKVEKTGAAVDPNAKIRLAGAPMKYVGRGGIKLEGALAEFGVIALGKVCLDIGASTGGFVDCLLRAGAAKIVAVDAGTNQLDWRLRQNSRVVVHERTNARYLTREQLGCTFDLVTVDVSFISATLILPALPPLLNPGADVMVLVKPQFEVGRGMVGKGGIVRDERQRQKTVDKVSAVLAELGFSQLNCAKSVLPGAEGNIEYFIHACWPNPD